jgi:hypothetical protein
MLARFDADSDATHRAMPSIWRRGPACLSLPLVSNALVSSIGRPAQA